MVKKSSLLSSLTLAGAAVGLLTGCGGGDDVTVNGAGASFPDPVYQQWTFAYTEETDTTINYQAVGSGAGIERITAGQSDFGASDAPLTQEELDEAGLVQWPMLIGSVVPVANVEGLESGDLKLTGEVLADIFLGKINNWSDPAIVELNKDVTLPDARINVVRRADSSGTTWIFTNYLSKVSEDWKNGPGWSKTPKWPEGVGIGAPKNSGVATQVEQNVNSIGYVESAFQKQAGLPFVRMQNQAGNFVEPSTENVQAAAASADWANLPGFYVVLTNQPGDNSWPICGATYILVHEEQESEEMISAILQFFDWCYREGDDIAIEQNYIPMPASVAELVREMWAEKISVNGGPAWPVDGEEADQVAAAE